MNRGKAQKAEITWNDNGDPVSQRFDDTYYARSDGLAESRYVFLDGNDLPARFRDGFHIAETGFGTGLNLLAAWQAWEESGMTSPLRFTSFEAYPMAAPDMARALSRWPELAPRAARLLAAWEKGPSLSCETLELRVILGDARTTLPVWENRADAWFLDGFNPSANPEMWAPELLQAVAHHTGKGGSFATYTAAGHVRRALADAGFTVHRRKGFGHKRHMSHGLLA